MTEPHDAKALLEGTTPGSWTYVRNPENTRWIIDSEPHHAIACSAGYGCDNEANARLIAAAPDLARQVITLTTRAETAEGEVKRLREERAEMLCSPVVEYLFGEGPFCGVQFGEGPPEGERGNFWWRKHLRAILKEQGE